MAQFDVHRTRAAATYPLVVDVQANVHAKLVTRLVAPMVTRARYTQPATRLTPVVRVRDAEYVVLVPLAAAVPTASLGEIVGSLALLRSGLIRRPRSPDHGQLTRTIHTPSAATRTARSISASHGTGPS